MKRLKKRLGLENKVVTTLTDKAINNPKRVVFAEADNYQILKAAQGAKDEGYAIPILLGRSERIKKLIADNDLDLEDVEIVDPKDEGQRGKREEFGHVFFEKRQRKGFYPV